MSEIFEKNTRKPNFLTLDHMGTPLKNQLRSDLSWPKLDLEQKFLDPGTFGRFGKRAQNFIQYPADF